MMSTDTPNPILHFSVAAADAVSALLKEENNPDLHLRVFVSGGGCSGLQYGFTFDTQNEEDAFVEQADSAGVLVKVLLDPISRSYLEDVEIDFSKGMQGAQFIVRNPKAKTTCGCGSSFSIEED